MSDDIIDQLDKRLKQANARRDIISSNKMKVEAVLASKRQQLNDLLEECRKAGFDPNNLQEETRRLTEIVSIKVDNYEADIEAAERIMKPILKEIE